jgi:transposase
VKRSVLTEGHGLPLAVAVSGANVHDTQLLELTLDNVIIKRPDSLKVLQNLCLDAGYTGYAEQCESRGYTVHIRPRGEEKKEIEHNPNFKARRWVVEVLHSWTNRFRKLLVRFEKKADNYIALLSFAFATIVWRNLIYVHQSSIVGWVLRKVAHNFVISTVLCSVVIWHPVMFMTALCSTVCTAKSSESSRKSRQSALIQV